MNYATLVAGFALMAVGYIALQRDPYSDSLPLALLAFFGMYGGILLVLCSFIT